MKDAIAEAIEQLLGIVQELRLAFPKKRFTLDGRLVGDIGEALAEQLYDITVFDHLERHHDARTSDGRLVQVKATMQNALTFPADHVPDYYLGLRIDAKGKVTEIFNGPGKIAYEGIKNRKVPKTNLHSISIGALKELNKRVPDYDKVKKRANNSLHPADADDLTSAGG